MKTMMRNYPSVRKFFLLMLGLLALYALSWYCYTSLNGFHHSLVELQDAKSLQQSAYDSAKGAGL